jgi:hypothetical protein
MLQSPRIHQWRQCARWSVISCIDYPNCFSKIDRQCCANPDCHSALST